MPIPALVRRLLELVKKPLALRPGEGAAVVWAMAMFFTVLASYYVLRPVRDALVLEGDPDLIPWLFTANFALVLAIAPPWGALVARWPRRQLVPLAYRAMIVQLLIFAALLQLELAATLVIQVFYIWVSMFNLFVVSVFWSLCADIARPEQGKRLFGIIAAGGTAGAIVGPLLTRFLAHEVSTAALLVISAVLLEVGVQLSRGLDAADRRLQALRAEALPSAAPAVAPAIGGSPFAGLTRVLRSPFLAGIGGYMVCTAFLATFIYVRQLSIVREAIPDRATRTAWNAEIELWSSLATIAVQLLVTSRLLHWLGVGLTLALLPLVQLAGVIFLSADPVLGVAAVVYPLGRALNHALARPSRELLFTAVAREDKFKTKNVIDTFAYRLGDTSSAWLIHELSLAGIAAPFAAVPLAIAWFGLSLALGVGYRLRTASPPALAAVSPARSP